MEKRTIWTVSLIVVILLVSTAVVGAVVFSDNGKKPNQVVNLQATKGDSKVTLLWDGPLDGAPSVSEYIIYKGTTSSNHQTTIKVTSALTYEDKDVRNGITYYYAISAKNSKGEGDISTEVSAKPDANPATVPSAPVSLTATAKQGAMKLTWQTPANNGGATVNNYNITWTNVDSSDSGYINVGNVLDYELDDLEEALYHFKVMAVNSVGTGTAAFANATPLAKIVENLNVGYVTTAGNHVGLGDMGVYLFRNTMTSEALIGVDEEGNYIPRLADSWETTDSKTWIFHLSHNATWHDGVTFNATDVKFTIDYTLDKKPWGLNDAAFMKDIESYEILDNYTFKMVMKTADSNLLVNMRIGMVIFPEHIFKFVVDPMTYAEKNGTIGTGPYIFESLDTEARLLKYTANPDYYRGGSPSIKNITIHFYGTADSMILALLSNEIDVTFGWGAGIDYVYVPKVLADSDLSISMFPSAAIRALNFNNQQYPFDNETFREAISFAIDYASLRDVIMGGYGDIANTGLVPDCMVGYIDTTVLSKNVTRANELLTSLGFVDINSDGYREYPNGTEFRPQLLTSTATHFTRSAEIIEKNLKAVGINVLVKASATFGTDKKARLYGMALSGTSQAGTYAWASYYTTQVDSRGGLADCQVNDSVFTALVGQLRNATTDAEKQMAAQALQEYYAEKLPAIALYWFDIIQPYNTKYSGYGFDPQFGTIMCYDTFFNLRRA